ncbi:hypothetical protein STEG23_012045 [Scotinomys teguina]
MTLSSSMGPRVGSASHLGKGKVIPVAQTSSSTTQTHVLGLGLAHPNIYPICDLLEFMKGLVRQSDSHRISLTQGGNWIFERHFIYMYSVPSAPRGVSSRTSFRYQNPQLLKPLIQDGVVFTYSCAYPSAYKNPLWVTYTPNAICSLTHFGEVAMQNPQRRAQRVASYFSYAAVNGSMLLLLLSFSSSSFSPSPPGSTLLLHITFLMVPCSLESAYLLAALPGLYLVPCAQTQWEKKSCSSEDHLNAGPVEPPESDSHKVRAHSECSP